MTNREKIMKGLECCSAMSGDECRECPYSSECLDENLPVGTSHLASDALWLLKTDSCGNCAWATEVRQMVVRCKDCKWWKDYKCENDYVLRQIFDCGCYPDFHTDAEWFCAEGERR